MRENLWTFKTARFQVSLLAEIERYPDLSWRDEEQERYDAEHGVEYYCFSVVVLLDGRVIARDTLGDSGYANPHDFAREHRDPDPMNRNCSIMRAARGNVCIGHYFPDMIHTAIGEAREYLSKALPRIRTVAA